MNYLLELNNIECRYDNNTVVKDFSFRVRENHLICLLGPSGCGKSTILRAIAGLEPVYAGEIQIAGETVSTANYSMPPNNRKLGMVFQDYALFPHMNIQDNICFGIRNSSSQNKRKLTEEMLEIVGLEGYEHRFPHELSGGQQQRVALARALAARPKLILMDEPFSNLDIELRERLSLEVRNILKAQKLTGVMVTHDQSEAFAMADKIGVLHNHELQQWDTAYNLYHDPQNRFVADFVGKGKFLKAKVKTPDSFETDIGVFSGDRSYEWPKNTDVDILVRPDDIIPSESSALKVNVLHRAFKGSEIFYTLSLPNGEELLSAFPSHHDYQVGDSIGIELDMAHLIAFKR